MNESLNNLLPLCLAQAEPATQSMLPMDITWAGVLILCITGLFVAALTIGVVSRIIMPERYIDNQNHT